MHLTSVTLINNRIHVIYRSISCNLNIIFTYLSLIKLLALNLVGVKYISAIQVTICLLISSSLYVVQLHKLCILFLFFFLKLLNKRAILIASSLVPKIVITLIIFSPKKVSTVIIINFIIFTYQTRTFTIAS